MDETSKAIMARIDLEQPDWWYLLAEHQDLLDYIRAVHASNPTAKAQLKGRTYRRLWAFERAAVIAWGKEQV